MYPVIYDVAVSIDGYISGPDGDISQFAHDGPVVDDYAARLATYTAAIMGRATYEFGYRYGLAPGQNPYADMTTFVFSSALNLPVNREIDVYKAADAKTINALKSASEGPIYLCGGGAFAGSLLGMGVIDILRLKRAPIVLGSGTRLFGDTPAACRLTNVETRLYDGGYVYQEFKVET